MKKMQQSINCMIPFVQNITTKKKVCTYFHKLNYYLKRKTRNDVVTIGATELNGCLGTGMGGRLLTEYEYSCESFEF